MTAREYAYNDDYATCVETYATLRIFPGEAHPDTVTARLGVSPTKVRWKDDPHRNPRYKRWVNGWFLCSESHINSRDNRRHVDWLLNAVAGSREELLALKAEGATMDIFCHFDGIGRGGPCLHPSQMQRLADLELWIGWDAYCDNDLPWDRKRTGKP